MENNKKSKMRVMLIILVIGLLGLTSFYFINKNTKVKNSKFVTITNPNDTDDTNIVKFYDENFNVLETKNVKDRGYSYSFETDDKYYVVGVNNFLSIDKKSKKIEEVENDFLEGTNSKIERYDGGFIFLDQIIGESDSDGEYIVHDVGNFNGDKIKSFKGTKPGIITLLKANDKYYAISSDKSIETQGQVGKRYIEVFDNEGNFLYIKEIENLNDYYAFYKHGDKVYVLAGYNPCSIFRFDSEKGEIGKDPITSVEEAGFGAVGEDLYLTDSNKVMKVNIDNLELEKVFDSNDYDGNKEEDTLIYHFIKKNSHLVILNKKVGNDIKPKELYIRSEGEKEYRKTAGESIIQDLNRLIFMGDFK